MQKWIGQGRWGEYERQSRMCSQWVAGRRPGRLRGRSSRHRGEHCLNWCRRKSGWRRRQQRTAAAGTCVEMDTGLDTVKGLEEASEDANGGRPTLCLFLSL